MIVDGMIFAYAQRQTPDGRDCQIYLRRDLKNSIDIIISDLGGGMFSFVRDTAEGFPISNYKDAGYKTCTESDFNDILIEAIRYFTTIKPQRKRK